MEPAAAAAAPEKKLMSRFRANTRVPTAGLQLGIVLSWTEPGSRGRVTLYCTCVLVVLQLED
jgi:hypothetical protein